MLDSAAFTRLRESIMSKSAQDTESMVAAFIARKGVTRVQEGERTISEKEFWQARREDRKVVSEEQRLIDERHIVVGSDGREHCRNGLGEWIY